MAIPSLETAIEVVGSVATSKRTAELSLLPYSETNGDRQLGQSISILDIENDI